MKHRLDRFLSILFREFSDIVEFAFIHFPSNSPVLVTIPYKI